MKPLIASFVVMILLCAFSFPISAEEEYVMPETPDLDRAVDDLDREIQETYDDFSLKSYYESFKNGEISFDFPNLAKAFFQMTFKELNVFMLLLAQLFFLGIIAAVFQTFQSGFSQGGISALGQWVIFLAFAVIGMRSFRLAFDLGTSAISDASNFLYALLPVLLGMLSSLGGLASMAVVKPTLLAMITLFLGILERFFMPLIIFMAVLALVGNISPQYSFENLRRLIRDVILIGLGFMMTIFTGLLGLESLATGAIDGMTMKTAKMAAGNFIPVVGRHISDALDSILGASLLMKNCIGFFGIFAVIIVIAMPSIKIFLMSLIYRLAAAVLQPFGQNNYTEMLNQFSSVLTVLFALVASTGILFFFLIFTVVLLGNITMMFR